MGYISRIAVCLLVTAISLSANTQEIPKQDPTATAPTGDLSTQKRLETIRITNTGASNAAITEQSAESKPPTFSNKEIQQQLSRESQEQPSVVTNTIPRSPVNNEFQKFVFDATGKQLAIFGSEFFGNGSSSFAPLQNTPAPADHVLGPGDEVLIRGWGTIEIDYRAIVDRNGYITIPTIGAVMLGGVKAGDAEDVIRGAVGKLYKGVTLNVAFGRLRAITVYVVGQARRPGTYTVPSSSTLVTALFASGGPNQNGSMRHVQVKRAGKVAAELDLYAFIAKGDNSADMKLQDGDTIYIPSAGGFVAVVGKVNSPGIYELRSTADTVDSLLEFAGGLPIVADPRRVSLERIDPHKTQPRMVEEFALDGAGLKKSLKNGDLLTITSIALDFSNAVTLRGNVGQAIRTPFVPGMRLSNLIPNRQYLVTRASVQRQNAAVLQGENDKELRIGAETIAAHIGDLVDAINWDYAVIERVNRSDLSVTLIPFNLGKMLDNPAGPDNIALQPGDIVTTFSQNDVLVPLEKRRVLVRVEGEVHVPGVYQMNSSDTIIGLISRAGGLTSNAYLFGMEFYREQVRKEQQANMEKVLRRLEAQSQSAQLRSIANTTSQNAADAQIAQMKRDAEMKSREEALSRLRELKPTGRVTFGLDPDDRSFNKLPPLKLENGDRLVVPSRPDFIHVYGAVNQESSSLWKPGMTLGRYLNHAGPTSNADMDAVFVLRADGSVLSSNNDSWFVSSINNLEIMPGDSIVVPEKISAETAWTRFMGGLKDWSQVFANFGLGAAAIQVLK